MRCIHCEAERRIASPFDASQNVFNPLHVALDVELENFWAAVRVSDFFQTRLGHGADEIDRAKFFGCLCYRNAAVRSDRLKRSDGSEHNRHLKFVAKESCGSIYSRDIYKHARAKREAIQSVAVSAHSHLRLCAACEVMPNVVGKIAPRGDNDFLVGNKVECHVISSSRVKLWHSSLAQFR